MSGYGFVRFVAGVYGKIAHRMEIHGKENVPSEGGCIIIANHASFCDPIGVACGAKRQVYFVAKSDLLKNGFMRWVLGLCDAVTINRGESDLAALRKVCDIVNNGNIAGIFPQGTRIPCDSPDVKTAQAGIGLIALKSKAPIVPVAICYGKKNKKPTVFRKVHVYIGKPVSYEEYAFADGERLGSHEIAENAFSRVCELFAEKNYG